MGELVRYLNGDLYYYLETPDRGYISQITNNLSIYLFIIIFIKKFNNNKVKILKNLF